MNPTRANRIAITTAEAVIATLLLAVATSGVLRLAVAMKTGLHNRELSTRLVWELINARETIGSWTVDEVTAENIQSLPLSDSIQQYVREASWSASVTEVEEPAAALQVELQLECELNGQAANPGSLTFWVLKPREESSQSSPDSEATEEKSSSRGGAEDE